MSKWKVVCMLAGSRQGALAESIQESSSATIIQVSTQVAKGETGKEQGSLWLKHFRLEDRFTFSSERSSLLLFTSGTTGSPKAAIHARRFFYSGQGFSSPCLPSDVFLLNRPVSWVG